MARKVMALGLLVAVALIGMASMAWAFNGETQQPSGWLREFGHGVLATLIYSILGIIVLLIGFKILDKATPFDLNREIAEQNNVAAGVLVAGMLIALGMIIAASIL